MKLVLVASLAAVLGLGASGKAQAHGYAPAVGGSFYWADDGVVVGLNYGGPYVKTHYIPPRYAYRPRAHRHAYRHGKRHGYHGGHHKGYRKGYYKGYKHGRRHGHHRHGHRYYHHRGH